MTAPGPLELVLILIVLSVLFYSYEKYRERNPKIEKPEAVEPYILPPDHEPYRQVLSIMVPPSDWNPQHAERLIGLLFAMRYPFILSVRAIYGSIVWSIEVGRDRKEAVINAVYSIYPQAQIEIKPKEKPDVGFQLYQLAGGTNFLHASKSAREFTKGISPLSAIVSNLGGLQQGDEFVYEVAVQSPTKNYTDIAYKLLYWKDGMDVYVPEYQKRLEAKAHVSLMDVRISTKYRASAARSEEMSQINSSCINALEQNVNVGNSFYLAKPQNAYPLVMTEAEVATLWHLPTADCQTAGISWAKAASTPLPSSLLKSNVAQIGIKLGEHSYHGQKNTVWLADTDRITHMNIVGKTRVGKTTFMHNLIHQDIANGQGVGVIDPHGDLVQAILECSIPPGREKDVVLFDLSDVHYMIPLNLLYVPPGVTPHAGVSLTMGVLKKLFAEQWSATRMEDALYSALAVLSSQQAATIRDIPKLFLNANYRRGVLKQAQDEVALEYFHEDYEMMSERYQLEVARPILNRIRAFYRNPMIREIVVQPDSVDFRHIMDGGKIFLASLAGEATQGESGVIGSLLISKMQMAAMSRAHLPAEKRRMFYLYVDEVQNFVTTSLSVMFSEAAKYALSLTVANQFLKQLEGGTLDAVMGNTGTTVMFACGNQDAKDLGDYVKPDFDAQTLLNLDRFETIIKMQQDGKTLPAFMIKTPSPVTKPDDADERKARIRRANYKETKVVVESQEEREQPEVSMEEVGEVAGKTKDTDIPTLDL